MRPGPSNKMQRQTNVVRFAESNIDKNDGLDNRPHEMPAIEPPQSAIAPSDIQHTQRECITLHIVRPEAASSLKFFKLHELPRGMLERTLGSQTDKRDIKGMQTGATCRAVHTAGKHNSFVFNGRMGQALPVLSLAEEEAFLGLVTFTPLHGISAPSVESLMKQWKFKESEEVTVSQWLAGMGQMEPDEPGQHSEMPKDAQKMLAADQSYQNTTLGRVRVPKGASFLPAHNDDEERSGTAQGTRDTTPGGGFTQLLKARLADDSESEGSDTESQASQGSEQTTTKANVTFSSLMQRGSTENKRPAQPPVPASAVLLVRQKAPSHLPVVPLQPSHVATVQQSSSASQRDNADISGDSMPAQADPFPSYGKQFAAVDTIGLTANAASQARWEIEHPSPRENASRGKIRLASAGRPLPLSPLPSTSDSAPMTMSTGRELQCLQPLPTSPSLASSSQATIRSYVGSQAEGAPWVNKIIQKRAPTGKLIDDTASGSPGPLKWPPGLGPPPAMVRHPTYHDQSYLQPPPSASQANGSLVQTLIDIDENVSSTNTKPMRPPPGLNQTLQPKKIAPSYDRPVAQGDDDDTIVERVQLVTDEPVTKRYTMRQKAPKKSKYKVPTAKPKVKLPLPDPVPPREAPKSWEAADKPSAGPDSTSKGALKARFATVESSLPANNAEMGEPQSLTESVSPATVDKLGSLAAMTKASRIDVHIGMVLINSEDKALRKATHSAYAAAFKLNTESVGQSSSTMFNPRLTTSISDAIYIMGLVEGPLVGMSVYEFHLRTPDGVSRSVAITSDATEILGRGNELGRAYMHFPTRVWDAIVMLKDDQRTEPVDGFADFLSSLHSNDMPPSFTAKIPSNRFAVEKVHATREYIRMPVGKDGRLVVTEVQELLLQSLNAPHANLEATCLSREEMIAQQRLWFEARLENIQDVAMLQTTVGDLVSQMDGVGFRNKGPWELREQEPARVAKETAPFW